MMSRGNKTGQNNKTRLGRTADRPYWIVILSIIIRAFHQVGAAVFLSAFILKDIHAFSDFYIILAAVTGILLLITEGMRHRQIFREVSGIITVLKLIVLGLAAHHLIPGLPSVLLVFLIASFFSHAPKSIRHRLLF